MVAAADKNTYLSCAVMTQPKLLQDKNCKRKKQKTKRLYT